MNMPRFDAIVFDFDGVLVDSVDVKTRAFAALYEPYGAEVVGKVVAWHLEHGGVSRHEKFRHFHRVFLDRPLPEEEAFGLAERFSALVEDAVVAADWIAGAREFVEDFHRHLPLYVASGTPEEELWRIVDRRGMSGYFAGVAGSPRKKGEILRDFIHRAGMQPGRVLMVGDAMTDYLGASETGTAFLGVAQDNDNPFPPGVPIRPDLAELAAFLDASSLKT
jgi:phosphoglycolate phosphatase-like HAD superfamily hydrolase